VTTEAIRERAIVDEDRASVRAWVDEVVAPQAAEADRTGRITADVLEATAARGLWGAVLPVSSGGTGRGTVTLGMLHEEVGRGCSSLRSLLTVHSMALYALERWGSGPAKQRWLDDLVSGRRLGAFCLTEPSAGSDIAQVSATATPVDDGYLLNGEKRWITGGLSADVFLVFARTDRGPAAFLVDAAAPGVKRTPVEGILGTRGSMLAEVRFVDVPVPGDALIGVEGMGVSVAVGTLDVGRFSVASGCVGILQACLDASVAYAVRRAQGGSPLAEHQLIQQMITRMSTDLRAARLLCQEAGRLKDEGDPATVIANCVAKYFASVAAMRAAGDAVQIHGANGCSEDYPVARYFRDAKIMEIIEGSSQIHEALIAQHALQVGG
jgi:alkylation response protein AidB-like acyl-CoA dehydrogenase